MVERDILERLRKALEPFAKAAVYHDHNPRMLPPDERLAPSSFTYEELRAARDALPTPPKESKAVHPTAGEQMRAGKR